ncbi:hypothetical protein ABK040_015994 [Willaertia magna]
MRTTNEKEHDDKHNHHSSIINDSNNNLISSSPIGIPSNSFSEDNAKDSINNRHGNNEYKVNKASSLKSVTSSNHHPPLSSFINQFKARKHKSNNTTISEDTNSDRSQSSPQQINNVNNSNNNNNINNKLSKSYDKNFIVSSNLLRKRSSSFNNNSSNSSNKKEVQSPNNEDSTPTTIDTSVHNNNKSATVTPSIRDRIPTPGNTHHSREIFQFDGNNDDKILTVSKSPNSPRSNSLTESKRKSFDNDTASTISTSSNTSFNQTTTIPSNTTKSKELIETNEGNKRVSFDVPSFNWSNPLTLPNNGSNSNINKYKGIGNPENQPVSSGAAIKKGILGIKKSIKEEIKSKGTGFNSLLTKMRIKKPKNSITPGGDQNNLSSSYEEHYMSSAIGNNSLKENNIEREDWSGVTNNESEINSVVDQSKVMGELVISGIQTRNLKSKEGYHGSSDVSPMIIPSSARKSTGRIDHIKEGTQQHPSIIAFRKKSISTSSLETLEHHQDIHNTEEEDSSILEENVENQLFEDYITYCEISCEGKTVKTSNLTGAYLNRRLKFKEEFKFQIIDDEHSNIMLEVFHSPVLPKKKDEIICFGFVKIPIIKLKQLMNYNEEINSFYIEDWFNLTSPMGNKSFSQVHLSLEYFPKDKPEIILDNTNITHNITNIATDVFNNNDKTNNEKEKVESKNVKTTIVSPSVNNNNEELTVDNSVLRDKELIENMSLEPGPRTFKEYCKSLKQNDMIGINSKRPKLLDALHIDIKNKEHENAEQNNHVPTNSNTNEITATNNTDLLLTKKETTKSQSPTEPNNKLITTSTVVSPTKTERLTLNSCPTTISGSTSVNNFNSPQVTTTIPSVHTDIQLLVDDKLKTFENQIYNQMNDIRDELTKTKLQYQLLQEHEQQLEQEQLNHSPQLSKQHVVKKFEKLEKRINRLESQLHQLSVIVFQLNTTHSLLKDKISSHDEDIKLYHSRIKDLEEHVNQLEKSKISTVLREWTYFFLAYLFAFCAKIIVFVGFIYKMLENYYKQYKNNNNSTQNTEGASTTNTASVSDVATSTSTLVISPSFEGNSGNIVVEEKEKTVLDKIQPVQLEANDSIVTKEVIVEKVVNEVLKEAKQNDKTISDEKNEEKANVNNTTQPSLMDSLTKQRDSSIVIDNDNRAVVTPLDLTKTQVISFQNGKINFKEEVKKNIKQELMLSHFTSPLRDLSEDEESSDDDDEYLEETSRSTTSTLPTTSSGIHKHHEDFLLNQLKTQQTLQQQEEEEIHSSPTDNNSNKEGSEEDKLDTERSIIEETEKLQSMSHFFRPSSSNNITQIPSPRKEETKDEDFDSWFKMNTTQQ